MDLRIGTITLAVVDLDRATHFYRDVLGLPELTSAPTAPLFDLGPVSLALRARDGLLYDTGAKVGKTVRSRDVFPGFTLTHHAADETDVDRLLADTAAAGGRVVRFPDRLGGRYAGYFADPDGFLWEVAFDVLP